MVPVVTLLVLLGIGWNFAFVSSTMLLLDSRLVSSLMGVLELVPHSAETDSALHVYMTSILAQQVLIVRRDPSVVIFNAILDYSSAVVWPSIAGIAVCLEVGLLAKLFGISKSACLYTVPVGNHAGRVWIPGSTRTMQHVLTDQLIVVL